MEVPDEDDIRNIAPDEGEPFYEQAVGELDAFLDELEFPLTVYRALVLEKEAVVEPRGGAHWSPHRDASVAFIGRQVPKEGEEVVLLQGWIPSAQYVDWEHTVEGFIANYGSAEFEITTRHPIEFQEVNRLPGPMWQLLNPGRRNVRKLKAKLLR